MVARLLFVVVLSLCLGACFSPESHESSPKMQESSMPIHQEGAPYPADLDHLEEILSVAQAELPVGARDVGVAPAVKFAASYPGGWGYVVSFTADEDAIRDYIDQYTSLPSSAVEEFTVATPDWQNADVNVSEINRPWETGLGTPPANTMLIIERPLGRGWLLIRGAPR